MATEDELDDLVAELGIDGHEAGDLVKGLSVDAVVKSGDNVSEKQSQKQRRAFRPLSSPRITPRATL
jgi:hypothetical protein